MEESGLVNHGENYYYEALLWRVNYMLDRGGLCMTVVLHRLNII